MLTNHLTLAIAYSTLIMISRKFGYLSPGPFMPLDLCKDRIIIWIFVKIVLSFGSL